MNLSHGEGDGHGLHLPPYVPATPHPGHTGTVCDPAAKGRASLGTADDQPTPYAQLDAAAVGSHQAAIAGSRRDIVGFVAVAPAEASVRTLILTVPDARVFIRGASGEEQHPTTTNSQGHFRISSMASGSYTACAAMTGFTTGCSPIIVQGHAAVLPDPIVLRPEGDTVRGCVTLKDGSPAVRHASSPQQTSGRAEVSITDVTGKGVAGPVGVNGVGCYMIPNVPSKPGLNVVANYEQASIARILPSHDAKPFDKRNIGHHVADAPPRIDAIAATVAAGT